MFGQLISITGWPTIPLEKTYLVVGRRRSCDVKLVSSTVSAFHCELFYAEERWVVRDLDSRNGTFVNGMRVAESLLYPGDELAFAKRNVFLIHYDLSNLNGARPAAQPPALMFSEPCAAFHNSVISGICPWCGQAVFGERTD